MISRDITTIFFQFMIIFVIFILGLEALLFYFLKKKKGIIEGKKVPLFGILMELNNSNIFAISILIIRYLFIIFSLFTNHLINIFHFIFISILSILYGISTKSIKTTIIEFISSLFISVGLFCQSLFVGYLQDVDIVWYVVLGNICSIVFLFLYVSFFLVKNLNEVISNNKYVRREKDESSQ